jgi:3-dehydroquinate synthase
MQILKSTNYSIEIGSILDSSFHSILETQYKQSKKIILVDENTKYHCLEYLITSFSELSNAEIIELPAGEENKQMDFCIQVWEVLTEYHIDRNALMINVGGGVISDMGGFISSLYKRGISFLNIPTTLLAMVDASVGGKTGVDLGVFKNQVGFFSFPKVVYIDSCFLATLDNIQIKNGTAEMIKHGLIYDKNHWNILKEVLFSKSNITDDLIQQSVNIKNQIVIKDPFEKNERKKLNFGHTVGHAIESVFLELNNPILHGFAIAAGIQIESFISFKMNFLNQVEYEEISNIILQYYPKISIQPEYFDKIISNTKQDKKNSNSQIKMVLLKSIGEAVVDVEVVVEIIKIGILNYVQT